jgi:hypothetical protein
MKRFLIIASCAVWFAFSTPILRAEEPAPSQKYEYAIIKWEGPDRIQYILPDRFEFARLYREGLKRPDDAQDEEYCLAFAANRLGKEGWEAVNLDSRRILLRRVKKN